jgi:muramoyltetrapeptide carboxypeptidase
MDRKNFLGLGISTTLGSMLPVSSAFYSAVKSPATLIKPQRLPENATLGLIAPASPIYKDADFDTMIHNLESFGYTLKPGKHVRDQRGYLAGTDEDRAADLHTMFMDNSIDGIVCVRGGWGSNRILPLIDFSLIKDNPKVLVGFSDITSLILSIQAKTGLVTFHGPVGKSEWNPLTRQAWIDVLHEGKTPKYEIPETETDSYTINSGTASGRLLGGNLTVLTSMLGSGYLPDFDGSILFLEDIGEDAYRIDRMLTQLSLNGILKQIAGFVFGKCTKCSDSGNSLTLQQVFEDHFTNIDIPAFYGAMISHEEQNITLPVGVPATINADEKTIQLLEAGVL